MRIPLGPMTRRKALGAAVLAGLMARRLARARASQPATPVSFEIPANACDCHTHIFADPRRYPFIPERTYTPEIFTYALPLRTSSTRSAKPGCSSPFAAIAPPK